MAKKAEKYLVIVESPAKAKTIGKYLGPDYEVMASMGHLRDLPKSKIGVDVDKDFELDYKPIKGKEEIIRELKKAADKADMVYLATDPDREGEAISWHLKELLNLFETLANPLACTCDDKEYISVAGKQVCLTGDFDHAARKDVEDELTNLGAEVKKSVVKKLDYLIVGGQGSDSWVAGNYGTKVKKALELQTAGAGVQIIREADFFSVLDRTPVPKQVEPQAKVEEAEAEEVTDAISTQMRILESDFIHALSSFDLNYDTTTVRAEHVITPKSGEYDRLRVVLEGNDLRKPKELTLFRFTGKRKIWVWFPNFICTIFAAAEISYERPDKTPWGRILFTNFPSFDAHESVVQQIFEEAIQGNSFDCCSRYLACSNAKKCIHPDIMMASQCTYRQNLHAGRIFYGENRNV